MWWQRGLTIEEYLKETISWMLFYHFGNVNGEVKGAVLYLLCWQVKVWLAIAFVGFLPASPACWCCMHALLLTSEELNRAAKGSSLGLAQV